MNKEQIIKEVISGNDKAIETLYREFCPLMKGVCYRIVKDETIVEDLVHDSFVLALLSLDKLRNYNRCGEWLTTIVRNVSLKYIEKQKRIELISLTNVEDESLSIADEDNTPESYISEEELFELIKKLPEGYRKVFKLSVIQGFSHEEISEILHIKPHSVSSQLTRAKKMLKKMLPLLLLTILLPIYFFLFKKTDNINNLNNKKQLAEQKQTTKENSANSPLSNCDSLPSQEPSLMLADNVKAELSVAEHIVSSDSIYINPISIASNKTVLGKDMQIGIMSRPLELIKVQPKETNRLNSNPWQLLAFGSSGSSLLQNVTNTILSSGGVSSGAPSVIRTWEEYADYLESFVHQGMSEDSLTLLHIAQNNKGEMIEQEYHERPLSFGLSFSKNIGKDLNLNFGIRYSLLKSTFKLGSLQNEIGNDSCYINKKQRIHYLGLPLGLSYNLISKKSFSTYAAFNVTMNVPISGKISEQYIILPNYKKTISETNIRPKIQWSTDVSVGFQYQFSPNWSLYAEPTFKWYIPNGSKYHTKWTERPCQFSIPFGIRFSW